MSTWVAATGSVRGTHHEHSGAPNEDHARARVDAATTVVAVADGHGAPQYTRAERGSRLATAAALDVLADVPDDLDRLPGALVRRWRELVEEDLDRDPPAPGEGGRHGPRTLYGTTLLAAAVIDDGLLFAQLGDGDTVLATCDGPAVRRPIPDVQYAFPGATDSLVQDDAIDRVRTAVVAADEFDPDVVLLTTDGVDAAHPGRGWHGEVMAETCQRLRTTAADGLGTAVEEWCREPARVGGDDTTMALLVRPHVLAAA